MTADSAVTNEFEASREYTTGQKLYIFQGVGCVATWGARDGNNIGRYLKSKINPDDGLDVSGLAHLVLKYLIDEYQADSPISNDIGFHVAGFNTQGKAYLYHVFWGAPRPNPSSQGQNYDISDHSPSFQIPIQLVYNGRNDIANNSIQTLIQEMRRKGDIRFDITTAIGMAQFSDMLVRFAAEITPEVGPPFQTALISPTNNIGYIINEHWSPINLTRLSEVVIGLEIAKAKTTLSRLQVDPAKITGLVDLPTIPSGISLTEEQLQTYRRTYSGGTVTPFTTESEDSNSDA